MSLPSCFARGSDRRFASAAGLNSAISPASSDHDDGVRCPSEDRLGEFRSRDFGGAGSAVPGFRGTGWRGSGWRGTRMARDRRRGTGGAGPDARTGGGGTGWRRDRRPQDRRPQDWRPRPEAARPEAAGPEAARPDAAGPEAARPDSAARDPTVPGPPALDPPCLRTRPLTSSRGAYGPAGRGPVDRLPPPCRSRSLIPPEGHPSGATCRPVGCRASSACDFPSTFPFAAENTQFSASQRMGAGGPNNGPAAARSSAVMSSPAIARAKYHPCAVSQPRAVRRLACSPFSTPSTVTVRPSVCARLTSAEMIGSSARSARQAPLGRFGARLFVPPLFVLC